jgi:prepilin-type N-terminal cleavage/methylation domain-containing protein
MNVTFRAPRDAYTLLELLVVVAIIGVLIALLIPAVQTVRESAARAQCQNNLKQLALAAHGYHDANKQFPPGIGFAGGQQVGPYGTCFFHMLPFMEQKPLYDLAQAPGAPIWGAWNPPNDPIYSRPIAILLCPTNPTVDSTGQVQALGTAWGASTSGANAQVFCKTDPDGTLLNPQDSRNLVNGFPDGTSNTILFGEMYALCTNTEWPVGGSLWAYWDTGKTAQPLHAGFAISWRDYSVGPASMFQVRPKPDGGCNPTIAATPHSAGINVAAADGSGHLLSASINRTVWWALCTPAGSEQVQFDW